MLFPEGDNELFRPLKFTVGQSTHDSLTIRIKKFPNHWRMLDDRVHRHLQDTALVRADYNRSTKRRRERRRRIERCIRRKRSTSTEVRVRIRWRRQRTVRRLRISVRTHKGAMTATRSRSRAHLGRVRLHVTDVSHHASHFSRRHELEHFKRGTESRSTGYFCHPKIKRENGKQKVKNQNTTSKKISMSC